VALAAMSSSKAMPPTSKPGHVPHRGAGCAMRADADAAHAIGSREQFAAEGDRPD
jgi:hypothetical protein